MKNKIKNKIAKDTKIYSVISTWYHQLLTLKSSFISFFFFPFKIKENKVVICNYYGKGYGDNGKYIAQELIKQKYNYDIVWLLKKELMGKAQFPDGIRVVEYGSLKGLYELATAKTWIDNSRKVFHPLKRKAQFYIQTWHGGISMKRIEKDAQEHLGESYIYIAKKDSKMADLFISNSTACTNMYQSSFWYEGKILELGSPRCDILLNSEETTNKKVKNFFNIKEDVQLLIYAPTFRTDFNTDVYNIDFEKLIATLTTKFGGKWKVLVRLHPNISEKKDFMTYHSNVLNATDYDDMYELLAASDILITDYSSTMFEFSLSGKPVFLYATDIQDYIEDRNFYFDIKSLPYPLSEDNGSLLKSIASFDESKYAKSLKHFYTKLGIKERGKASSQVVKKINEFARPL